MTFRERWIRQPQTVWLRRALFQIHMCTGLTLGAYVVLISITGSAVVFRAEWNTYFDVPVTVYAGSGPRLTEAELVSAAQRAYPGYDVAQVFLGKNPDSAAEIWLKGRDVEPQRLFHPYTGEDLGEAVPRAVRLMSWMVDLHDNLLAGTTGRIVNGVGAICLALLCATGLVIWWPGIRRWRRSLSLTRGVGWKCLTWDLHSAIGFWSLTLVSMWALSGIYMAFPQPFLAFVDLVDPPLDTDVEARPLDTALQLLTRLHFGRYFGVTVKILWVILGLVPPVLFVTGAIAWWNRVLVPARRMRRRKQTDLQAGQNDMRRIVSLVWAMVLLPLGTSFAGAQQNQMAFLVTSTQGPHAVNARDRIDKGPWRNAKGVVIARSAEDLHRAKASLTRKTVFGLSSSVSGRPRGTED